MDRLRGLNSHFTQQLKCVPLTDSLFEIRLNKPKQLNALCDSMCMAFLTQLRTWKLQPSTQPRCLVLTGEGQAFCAGGDLKQMFKKTSTDNNQYLLMHTLSQTHNIFRICVLNGVVMGAGVGMMWHAPVRIATENTVYAMPETRIGFFPDNGCGYCLPRINNNDFALGLFIALTGARVRGKDLVTFGLATHYMSDTKIQQLYSELQTVSKGTTDEQLMSIVDSLSEPVKSEIQDYLEIQQYFQDDSVQNIFSRLEQSGTKFATKTMQTLRKMSPLGLACTFEQMKRGRQMSVTEVFQMETDLAYHMIQTREIHEGIRALIIDKDLTPQWKFKSVSDVQIDKFFKPLAKHDWSIV